MKQQSYPEPLLDRSFSWPMKIWDSIVPIEHISCLKTILLGRFENKC